MLGLFGHRRPAWRARWLGVVGKLGVVTALGLIIMVGLLGVFGALGRPGLFGVLFIALGLHSVLGLLSRCRRRAEPARGHLRDRRAPPARRRAGLSGEPSTVVDFGV